MVKDTMTKKEISHKPDSCKGQWVSAGLDHLTFIMLEESWDRGPEQDAIRLRKVHLCREEDEIEDKISGIGR